MSLFAFLGRSPDAAVLVCTAGIILIYIELNRPGLIVAGATGLLLTLTGIAALSRLPIWWPSLIFFGLAMLTLAAGLRRTITPPLAILLTAAVTAGCVFLVRGGPHIHLPTAIFAGVVLGAGTSLLTRIARRARVNKGLD